MEINKKVNVQIQETSNNTYTVTYHGLSIDVPKPTQAFATVYLDEVPIRPCRKIWDEVYSE